MGGAAATVDTNDSSAVSRSSALCNVPQSLAVKERHPYNQRASTGTH